MRDVFDRHKEWNAKSCSFVYIKPDTDLDLFVLFKDKVIILRVTMTPVNMLER